MTTETLRGEMRCSHIDERSAEEGLGALLLMDASPPDISTSLLGQQKPLYI